jgi:hypothetical protein
MKKLTYFVIITVCTVICACRKTSNTESTYPAPIDFELIDKSGNDLIHSLRDSVKVSYMQDGVLKYHNLSVEKLQVSASDTTTVKYYNGLVIDDRGAMTSLNGFYAGEPSAIHNFVIYLNGVAMGNIYLDYWNLLGSSGIYSQYCTFNNVPCKADVSFSYFRPGMGILVLQTQ